MPFRPGAGSDGKASADVQVHEAWARLVRIIAHGTWNAHARILRERRRWMAVVR